MQRCARTIACLVLLGILSVVAFGSFSVMALPPIPMRTQGHALDQGGSSLSIGTPIRTFVDGVNYTGGRFPGDTMAVQDGTGSFAVLTAGNSKTNANASDTPAVRKARTWATQSCMRRETSPSQRRSSRKLRPGRLKRS